MRETCSPDARRNGAFRRRKRYCFPHGPLVKAVLHPMRISDRPLKHRYRIHGTWSSFLAVPGCIHWVRSAQAYIRTQILLHLGSKLFNLRGRLRLRWTKINFPHTLTMTTLAIHFAPNCNQLLLIKLNFSKGEMLTLRKLWIIGPNFEYKQTKWQRLFAFNKFLVFSSLDVSSNFI